jgi:putative transposase
LRPETGYGHTLRYLGATRVAITLKQRFFPTCYGPEYVSGTRMEWAENRGMTLAHIQPHSHTCLACVAVQRDKPQQNAYVERYNRTVRHEWLDLYIFESIDEVQQIATEWLWSYNHERPNIGNGGMTPAQKLRMAA